MILHEDRPRQDTPSARPLLPHVPERQRGPLMNRFLELVRRHGITDPKEIVKQVVTGLRQDLQRRGRWYDAADLRPLRETLVAVLGHPTEALALAQEAVAYEQLTPAQKAQHKAERSTHYARASMHGKPPTPKQLSYLNSLGVATAPTDRLEASRLIDGRIGKGVRGG
jgi:hypothetical protein